MGRGNRNRSEMRLPCSMSKSDELRERVENLQSISKRLREEAERLEAEAEKLEKAIKGKRQAERLLTT